MDIPNHYKCLQVIRSENGVDVQFGLASRQTVGLHESEVRVKVLYSSINYKDALAARGHPGVALISPLVPGIDAVGVVVESRYPDIEVGESVIIAHEEFGTKRSGGWQEFVSVPGDWLIPLPKSMDPAQAMAWGTAGFTAAQSVEALQVHGVQPSSGSVAVTGATGGVGICSTMLLHMLGYHVIAISGKTEQIGRLHRLGAAEVIARDEFIDNSPRPLLSGRFSGAIDTVGGPTLSTVIKSMKRAGCVTACGNTSGSELSLTIFPFILRGVTLVGIDSAGVDNPGRRRIWNRLATDWLVADLPEITTEIKLEQVSDVVAKMLDGRISGRFLIRVSTDAN